MSFLYSINNPFRQSCGSEVYMVRKTYGHLDLIKDTTSVGKSLDTMWYDVIDTTIVYKLKNIKEYHWKFVCVFSFLSSHITGNTVNKLYYQVYKVWDPLQGIFSFVFTKITWWKIFNNLLRLSISPWREVVIPL